MSGFLWGVLIGCIIFNLTRIVDTLIERLKR